MLAASKSKTVNCLRLQAGTNKDIKCDIYSVECEDLQS